MNDLNVEDHYIFFGHDNLQMPLLLHGIIFYFISRTPTHQESIVGNDILLMTPDGNWNPRCSSYATNEENILD